jgi:hypothetical protein
MIPNLESEHASVLENDYQRMRREMCYGPLLEWSDVFESLRALKDEIDRSH